jgi:hypothetical protein
MRLRSSDAPKRAIEGATRDGAIEGELRKESIGIS